MRRESSLLLISVVFLALIGSYCFSLGETAEELGYYPGRLRIQQGKNLYTEEREVEARFAKYLEEHTDEAIARYQEKFGKVINTDNARELSQDYAPGGIGAADPKTKAARSTWSNAVHEPSSALVKEIYQRELKKPAAPGQLDRVVFTAGGTAAGKTTALSNVPAIANLAEPAQIIYDTTLSSLNSSLERIAQALEAGKTVTIVYLHRDPVEAFVNGVLPRVERMGRTIPVEVFLETHIGAPKVLLQIAEKYKDDPRVAIAVIDNSRGRGKAVVADLELVNNISTQHSPEELRAKLLRVLEMRMKKKNVEKKAGARRPSVEEIRAMTLREYTDLLAQGMVNTLNYKTTKRGEGESLTKE